jgi:hypothetical protein
MINLSAVASVVYIFVVGLRKYAIIPCVSPSDLSCTANITWFPSIGLCGFKTKPHIEAIWVPGVSKGVITTLSEM